MRRLAAATLVSLLVIVAAGCGGSAAGAAGGLTRGQLAEEAGFTRAPTGGWSEGECEITRIFVTRREVEKARAAEERRDGPDGPDPGGLVVSVSHERFGVELGHGFGYCQQAIEEGLAWVGKGGRPEGTPTTVVNARGAIEALEDPIELEEPAGENGVIVGRVHGRLGEHFAFFLFINRSAPDKMPGVAGYPGFEGRGGLLGGGLVEGYIFGSREIPRRGESQAQFKEQSRIEGEVTTALCMQATGEGCGI
ncbi:MAG TPA: hypothetical protein VJ204_19600 [Solirubrobacterales bacterium]|nr:hypothetical protein [Solirubrobacterales bacterium]